MPGWTYYEHSNFGIEFDYYPDASFVDTPSSNPHQIYMFQRPYLEEDPVVWDPAAPASYINAVCSMEVVAQQRSCYSKKVIGMLVNGMIPSDSDDKTIAFSTNNIELAGIQIRWVITETSPWNTITIPSPKNRSPML